MGDPVPDTRRGYRIIKAQMKVTNPKTTLTLEEKESEFKKLFLMKEKQKAPERKKVKELRYGENFTEDEVLSACNKLKDGKAPGPDGLPPEATKSIIRNNLGYFQTLFNNSLRENVFPVSWKCAKLILIEKPKMSPNEPNKYRPICLINTIAKVYENLINSRLLEEIEKRGDFHEKQFGFRKDKTTIDAVNLVVENARRAGGSGKWNALI